jgi:hypothetical protein
MRPLFHHLAALEHADLGGVLDGTEAVCDYEHRAPLHKAVKRLLHRPLAETLKSQGPCTFYYTGYGT